VLRASVAIRRLAPAFAIFAIALNAARAQEAPPILGGLFSIPTDIYNPPAADAESQTADAASVDQVVLAARNAAAAGAVSDAFRLAVAAIEVDPNHADARRLLGYRRIGDQWAGSVAEKMLADGNAWSPKFGWVKASDLPKYEQGLRPSRGRWVSAEEDARQHAKISGGWSVRTDHVLVTTNIDRAAAAELATRLEGLYQIWRQLFGEFAATPEELQARLDGKEGAGFTPKPFRVVYYRDRAEYNAALRRIQPQIESTLGIYFDSRKQSHFFAGEDQDMGVIAHEAVHQFFYESARKPTRHLAATANVWAVEGVACYFETLMPVAPNTFTLGGADAGRLQAARHRRTVDNYYVPLAELCALGMIELQARPDLPKLYSQSAGLASFLIDGQNGRYRPAFRELLAAIYAGRDTADTLAEAAGVSYAQLDREYFEFMQSLPVTAAILP
jgi:hypothetical protein